MKKTYPIDTYTANWRFLYRLGGIAALIAVVVFRRNLSAEFSAFNGFGIFKVPQTMPVSAGDWFALLNSSRFVGLVYLGLTDLINYMLVGLLFLALGAALWKTNRGAVLLALTLAWAGIIIFIATNQAFSMLSLADQFANASGDARRSLLLAAGEALLAVNNPGRALPGLGSLSALFLVTLSALAFSVLMLRSDTFKKPSAWGGHPVRRLSIVLFPLPVPGPPIWSRCPSCSPPPSA